MLEANHPQSQWLYLLQVDSFFLHQIQEYTEHATQMIQAHQCVTQLLRAILLMLQH